MDISEISAQFLNASFIPLSSSSSSIGPAIQPGKDSAFEDLLKRTQDAAVKKADVSAAQETASRNFKNLPIDKTDKLYELCLELETFLIKNLIKGMRNTVQKSNLIDSGFAGEMYEDMLYDEYAKVYSKNANFGFAEMAYRELKSIG